MKFISFTPMSSNGLDHKVNDFLKSHPDIEVIDIKFSASFGSICAAILFREKIKKENGYI